MPESSPDTETQSSTAPSGRFRAFAFTGGFDAVVQLGVAHALLVSHGCAPDAVVGVSGGAVNAAALAEILQAGDQAGDGDPQAQVDQLRKFLDSYQKVPGEIVRSILPDAFEINALKPLRPIELPIHFKEERADRNSANRSRWGLSYALNKLSGLGFTVRQLTRITHCVLEIIAAAEMPRLARYWKRFEHLALFWLLSPSFVALAPLVRPLLYAALAGSSRRQHGSTAGRLLRHPTRHGWRALRAILMFLEKLILLVLWALSGLAPILILLVLVARAVYGVLRGSSEGLTFLSRLFVSHIAWLANADRLRRTADKIWSPGRWLWESSAVWLYVEVWVALLLVIVLTFVVPWLARRRRAGFRLVFDRILEHLALNDGLANTYALKQQLVACFDREYYGKIEIEEVLKRASDGVADAIESNPKRPKKTLGDYRCRTPSIQVGAVVAEVRTGDLLVLDGNVPVVDALLAATAFVPLFPAVEIAPSGQVKRYFIDAGNISREAIGPLVGFIRNEEKLDHVTAVDIYPVHRLRDDSEAAVTEEASSLVHVALRALQLQRLRDAKIERRLTRLYSRVLYPAVGRVSVAGRPFVIAEVFPLGIETRASLGHDLWRKTGFDLRKVIYQEVADGCRAALEGMMPEKIRDAADRLKQPSSLPPSTVPCRAAIAERLGTDTQLPGSQGSKGPGLVEICEHCVLRRLPKDDMPQTLCVPKADRQQWPEWPVMGRPAAAHPPKDHQQMTRKERTEWPVPRRGQPGLERPLISMLFGGGVFRGVFHMGVLNALNELDIVPDLVAGSSVGSIVAAMIAQVFTLPEPLQRRAQIARLSATFLAIDRLVLSDRMADFVRGFTVRAGETNFSPRDLDLALRRYDFDRSASFIRRLRKVAAGVERLFYFSPAAFLKLVESGRNRRFGELVAQLEEGVQKFLERGGVGEEILGAEPLALLIRSHVIEPLAQQGCPEGLFSSFIGKGIYFLATTTNLTQGKLEILGDTADCGIPLLEGLLASSAFPAIFRPREGWEIFHRAFNQERYFDGGIIDNLPLDAVAEFLYESADLALRPQIDGRPVPHLLFTASLEVDKQVLRNDRVETVSRSFRRLRKRAKTFIYNRKMDAFAKVQSDLRTIYEARADEGKLPSWTPLDLHLVAVKPQWLCSTFGFHPMLGFSRRKQAQSIAHGCASTLAQLYAEKDRHPDWIASWGIRGLDHIDPESIVLNSSPLRLIPQHKDKAPGVCWFRKNVSCPFSPSALKELSLEKETTAQLGRIFELCGQEATHRPV
jgi:predicted acylesterase/phospholipase RssA